MSRTAALAGDLTLLVTIHYSETASRLGHGASSCR